MNKNMCARTLLRGASVVSLLLAFGCDNHQEARQAAERKRQAEEAKAELAEFRTGMANFFSSKHKGAKAELDAQEKVLLALQKDINDLTAEVDSSMSAKDEKGVDLPIEDRFVRVLKSAKVNALASRYLKTEFRQDAAVLEEQARQIRAEERRYADALKDVDANYARSVKASESWTATTEEQREKEKSRLKQELVSLERSRNAALKEFQNLSKNKLHGNERQERERRENLAVLRHRVADFDDQIYKKRNQLDFLTNPNASRNIASESERQKQDIQRQANNMRANALTDLERRMKPKRSTVDIVTEFDKKTIGALKKAMTDALSKQKEQVEKFRSKVNALNDALLLVPVSEKEELIRLRKTFLN